MDDVKFLLQRETTRGNGKVSFVKTMAAPRWSLDFAVVLPLTCHYLLMATVRDNLCATTRRLHPMNAVSHPIPSHPSPPFGWWCFHLLFSSICEESL